MFSAPASAVWRRRGSFRSSGPSSKSTSGRKTRLLAGLPAQRALYEQALRDVARLSSYLAAEGSARRELIQRSERLGLLVNASLVFIALAAVVAVSRLRYRERRLTTILERRVDEELALRQVARALGGASTVDDVLRHVAEGATATTQASGGGASSGRAR